MARRRSGVRGNPCRGNHHIRRRRGGHCFALSIGGRLAFDFATVSPCVGPSSEPALLLATESLALVLPLAGVHAAKAISAAYDIAARVFMGWRLGGAGGLAKPGWWSLKTA